MARIFGLSETGFARLRARFVPNAKPDPYHVLGVAPDTPLAEIRKVWRVLVRETHPDSMMAQGLPEEAIKLSERRLVAINEAWAQIREGRV